MVDEGMKKRLIVVVAASRRRLSSDIVVRLRYRWPAGLMMSCGCGRLMNRAMQ